MATYRGHNRDYTSSSFCCCAELSISPNHRDLLKPFILHFEFIMGTCFGKGIAKYSDSKQNCFHY